MKKVYVTITGMKYSLRIFFKSVYIVKSSKCKKGTQQTVPARQLVTTMKHRHGRSLYRKFAVHQSQRHNGVLAYV